MTTDPDPGTAAPRCPCGRGTTGTRTCCSACSRMRIWARDMRKDGARRLDALERRCERIARSGRRSWECVCGAAMEPSRNHDARCSACTRVVLWARSMRTHSGRRFRSLQRWAERIAAEQRRSWLCRCGNELPDPRNCRHCADCARLRRWAKDHSLAKMKLFADRMEYVRANGDWLCTACGSYQGPAEEVACTACGCNVSTGEPGIAAAIAHERKMVVVQQDELARQVVWNGSSPVSLVPDWSIDSHIAELIAAESDRRQYRIDRRMW